MNENDTITVFQGLSSLELPRADYPTAEAILNSALVRSELNVAEGSVLQDPDGDTVSGTLPAGISRFQVQRTAGDKNCR